MVNGSRPQVEDDAQQQLAQTLGLEESVGSDGLTLSEMRSQVEARTDPEFASKGEAIRRDLEGSLDAELLAAALEDLAERIDRLPAVREAGIPEGDREPERLYRELVEPGWRVYEHLVDVGFFESVDENSPRFEPEHIESTARELIQAEPLTEALEALGFDRQEQTALVMSVTNNQRRLSRWVPTAEIPSGVEFDVEHVPPLHQRASGGALLWIRTMDVHLWQKSILITEEILDDAYWDIKAMLAGLYLMTRAALEVADPEGGELSDSQLTAALSAGAAIMITNQEDLCQDAYRITEEMRAPPETR